MGGSSSKQSTKNKNKNKNKKTNVIQPSSSTPNDPVLHSPQTPQQSNLPQTSVTPLNISVDINKANQNFGQGMNKNLSTDMLITPGREEGMYSKVAYTPQGEQARTYKYYCPLCMSFCMDIFKSKCCDNYTCGECCTDFLNKRDRQISTMNDLLQGAPYKDTACPHCNTLHFHPTLVTKTETVRDYSYNTGPTKPTSGNKPLHSPLKIGDSFEVMKNKMEKLDTCFSTTITEEGAESPNKTLFPPESARDTPRGIAMSSSGGVHRATASSFVNNIFASQGQSDTHPSGEKGNSSSVSDTAVAFVHNIFNGPGGTTDGRRHSKSKIAPLNFNDDAFDTVSIEDSDNRIENSERQVISQ